MQKTKNKKQMLRRNGLPAIQLDMAKGSYKLHLITLSMYSVIC